MLLHLRIQYTVLIAPVGFIAQIEMVCWGVEEATGRDVRGSGQEVGYARALLPLGSYDNFCRSLV